MQLQGACVQAHVRIAAFSSPLCIWMRARAFPPGHVALQKFENSKVEGKSSCSQMKVHVHKK
jgi:hypothetical protein